MSHRLRGAIVSSVGLFCLGLFMFLPVSYDFDIFIGIGSILIFCVGLLDFLGALQFQSRKKADASKKMAEDLSDGNVKPSWFEHLQAHVEFRLVWAALALFVAGACRVSVRGTLAASVPEAAPILFGLGLLVAAAAVIPGWVRAKRTWQAKQYRSFTGEYYLGFMVFFVATATVMATLGSQGLWDCWETHYGEVSRRQVEQDDWISLFWENKWFFSKPILIFWMMNIGMSLFGVQVTPDNISAYAEWGVRFMVGALSIAVLCAIYQLLARRISKRAGVFSAVIFATMPLSAFMTRQAITDPAFVGLMVLAVVFFLLGITQDPDARVKSYNLPIGFGKTVSVSAFHALIVGYVFTAIPQFVYVGTRSALFRFGTLGRGDLRLVGADMKVTGLSLSDAVGNLFGIRLGGATDISLDWFLLGLLFAAPFLFILYTLRNERRIARLCYHGMYISLALSVLAKGLPGLALAFLALLGLWVFYSPWKMVVQKGGIKGFWHWHWDKVVRLDLGRGIPMFLLIATPWYLSMFMRHGMKFIMRFFVHDHYKRLSVGVHGDSGTIDYYVQQLGYATFPWIMFVPLALFYWYRMKTQEAKDGIALSSAEAKASRSKQLIQVVCVSWAFLSFALFSMMTTKFHHYTFPMLPGIAIMIGIFFDDIWSHKIKRLGIVAVVGAATIGLVLTDLASDPTSKGVLSGFTQLVGLFIYKYSRPYPVGEEYNIATELIVFGSLFVIFTLAMIPKVTRRAAILITMVCGLVFGHWLIQHHMVSLAPHWTQKHLIDTYYRERTSPDEKLVAYQMNWKGENFYTGNSVKVYVSTKNKQFEKWTQEQRGKKHFFITEPNRFKRMSSRTKAAAGPFTKLSTIEQCNKYQIGVSNKL